MERELSGFKADAIPYLTVRDAISDLPRPVGTEVRNAPEITPDCWVRKKEGGTDLFGRLWWDRPAFTIRMEFYKPEKGRYLHPDQHGPITYREAARLQTFPDTFRFSGT